MKPFACLVAFFCCLLHLCDAATVDANFISSSTIPVTAASYTAAGNDVQLSLGFAPPVGTNLTIVKNTGLPFINGQFSNLAHGQSVDLSYSGKTYRFVANYYGGSGNDLVLEWAYRILSAGVQNLSNRLLATVCPNPWRRRQFAGAIAPICFSRSFAMCLPVLGQGFNMASCGQHPPITTQIFLDSPGFGSRLDDKDVHSSGLGHCLGIRKTIVEMSDFARHHARI